MIKAAVLALAAATAFGQNSITIGPQSKNFECVFNGNSGSFKLYLNSNGSNAFYNINYMQITEVDSSGNPVGNGNQRTLSLQGMPWQSMNGNGNSYVSVVGQVSGQYVTPNSGPTAYVTIVNNLTSVDTPVVLSNNVTVNVQANTLKISVAISGWSVATAGNQLQLRVKMSTQGKNGGQPTDVDPALLPAGNNQKKVMLPANGAYSAQIVFETYAFIKNQAGAWLQYPVSVTTQGNQNYINLPGSTSGDMVFWDPTISTVPNSALAKALSLAAVVMAALASVFLF